MSWEHAAEARAALNAIVTDPEHGVPALSSPQTMSNLLKDLLPDAPREKSILVAAAEAGLANNLRQHVDQGMDPNTAIRLAASSFSATTPFTPEACSWVTGEIATALGISHGGQAGGGAGPGFDRGQQGMPTQIAPIPGGGYAPGQQPTQAPGQGGGYAGGRPAAPGPWQGGGQAGAGQPGGYGQPGQPGGYGGQQAGGQPGQPGGYGGQPGGGQPGQPGQPGGGQPGQPGGGGGWQGGGYGGPPAQPGGYGAQPGQPGGGWQGGYAQPGIAQPGQVGGYGQPGYGPGSPTGPMGPMMPGGPGGPIKPRGSRRGLWIGGGIAAVVVVAVVIAASLAGGGGGGGGGGGNHHTSPSVSPSVSPSTSASPVAAPHPPGTDALVSIMNPVGLTPVGQNCYPSKYFGIDPATLDNHLYCPKTTHANIVVWGYQFDNSADYQKGLAQINHFVGFDRVTPGGHCPPSSGSTEGKVGWHANHNSKYKSKPGQDIECVITGREPILIWTMPTQDVFFVGEDMIKGSSLHTIIKWWETLDYGS
jgi:hypothetical protein